MIGGNFESFVRNNLGLFAFEWLGNVSERLLSRHGSALMWNSRKGVKGILQDTDVIGAVFTLPPFQCLF